MIEEKNIPAHIAIIMDGNGRWAKERGLLRTEGHKKGIERIKEIIKAANDLGIKVLSLFCFSTENWNRPKREIDMLMRSLYNFLKKELKDLNKKNIRLVWSGKEVFLPDYLVRELKKAMNSTQSNTGLIINLCLNYGGRVEILDAAKGIAEKVSKGEMDIDEISEEKFSDFLYTKRLPDPDLLIRTSGELRISNFFLWQISYTEFLFLKKYWPDFTRTDLEEAIKAYQKRERKFGRV